MIPVSTPRAPKSTRFTSTATTEGSQLLQPETRKPSDDADAEIDDGNFRVVHSPKTEYVKTSLKGRLINYTHLFTYSARSDQSARPSKISCRPRSSRAARVTRRFGGQPRGIIGNESEMKNRTRSAERASEPELLSRGSLDR